MREFNLIELFNMTRAELFALHSQIVTTKNLPWAADVEKAIAQTNLRRIRHVLANAKLTL